MWSQRITPPVLIDRLVEVHAGTAGEHIYVFNLLEMQKQHIELLLWE